MKKLIRNITLATIYWISAVIISIYSIIYMASQFKRFMQAEIIYIGEDGFGYTLEIPDCLRRLYSDKKVLCIFMWGRGRYNKYVKDIFNSVDIMIINLPSHVSFLGHTVPFGYIETFKWIAKRLLPFTLRWLTPTRFEGRYFGELLPAQHLSNRSLDDPKCGSKASADFHIRFPIVLRYFRYRLDTSAQPRARLPKKLRDYCTKRLENFNLKNDLKFSKSLCLYNRKKGSPGDKTSFIRSGSDIKDYIKSIKWLNNRGYQVFLVGDEDIPLEIKKKLKNGIVDNNSVNIERDLYQIWAATECDAYIGCPAGGANIAIVAERPTLIINAFPMYYAHENAAIYFKYIKSINGDTLPLEKLFGEHYLDFDFSGFTIEFNNEEQIYEAIVDFITRFENGAPLGISPSVLPESFDDRLMDHVGGYISAPWLKAYNING